MNLAYFVKEIRNNKIIDFEVICKICNKKVKKGEKFLMINDEIHCSMECGYKTILKES